MANFDVIRYDFFGEMSFDSGRNVVEHDSPMSHNDNVHEQVNQVVKDVGKVEDSMIDFLTEYFHQGGAAEDFSTYFQEKDTSTLSTDSGNEGMEINSANSSSSDINTSNELFTSPDTSAVHSSSESASNSFEDSRGRNRSSERKSISYEIRFTNSKHNNPGRVKLHIVPSRKTMSSEGFRMPATKGPLDERLRHENEWLRQRVHDLERKLHCVEAESERVVSELTSIIERKNEVISQLELQLAGIKFTSSS